MRRAVPVFLLLTLFSTVAMSQEVMYVDDKLVVTLRTGQGNAYKIIRTLESGTRLEVLETAGEYVRVREPKGEEGWIQLRYLTGQPVARDRLASAEQKIAALEADKQKLRDQISSMEGTRSELKKERSQLEKENQRMQQELAEIREVAATPVKLHNENKTMRERLTALEEEAQRLRADNEKLRDDTYREWFLTGAGVLGGGILLGLVLPKLRRRKSSWGDF